MTNRVPFCDGVGRRDFLRLGTAGLFGMGLSLPGCSGPEAHAARPQGPPARDVSLIFVFLHGGMSTIDAWDMKPDAPAEFRGEFKPIATRVPGIAICEHMPRLAGQMDKVSLIRSFRHGNSGHGQADHYMLTGYHPTAAFNPTLRPNNQRPVDRVGHRAEARAEGFRAPVRLPAQACTRARARPTSARSAAPFVIDADPNAPDFAVPDIVPPPVAGAGAAGVAAGAAGPRRPLPAHRRGGRQPRRAVGRGVPPEGVRPDDLVGRQGGVRHPLPSPTPLRDEYGRNSLGQGCLMARRLVEAGVRCVTIDHSNWDTHADNFGTLKNSLLPALDAAMATLFRDLADRGLLDRTLVVVSGEFGRTPRINKDAGRDHWGPAFTVALGGGGIRGGVVIGRTDARAEKPADDPHGPEDLAATIHRCLGIDPDEEFLTPEGRPVKIVNNGRVIQGLI